VVATECRSHPNYKKAVVEAQDVDTVIIGRAVGFVRRVIRTPLAEKVLSMERDGATAQELISYIKGVRGIAGAIEGDLEKGLVHAGQIAGLIKDTGNAEKIIQGILSQAREIKKYLQENNFCI
jgi:enoyl-[acyl-carrier protein] reductase II